MVECNGVKVIKAVKFIVHLGLFIAFIILTSLALKDLLSEKTTFFVTQEYRDLVLPSFTTCLYSGSRYGMYNESTLASNSSKLLQDMKWANLKSIRLKHSNGTQHLVEKDSIKKYYSIQSFCKPSYINESFCEPCLSFNTLKIRDKIQTADNRRKNSSDFTCQKTFEQWLS